MADIAALIHHALSGERAHALVKEITAFYRSPGSAGYHAATNMVAKILRESGYDDLEETRYPIDGETECQWAYYAHVLGALWSHCHAGRSNPGGNSQLRKSGFVSGLVVAAYTSWRSDGRSD